MKVLITGANGYIGRHVAKELLDRGHEVIGADLSYDGLDERAERSDVPIFSGDSDIYEKFGRPDLCIHLAWRNGFDHNNFSHVQDLPGHYLFLRNMMQGGLPHLSVMSTMHEVGYFEGAISEDTPTNPLTPYGIAKNALRELVQAEAKKDGCVLQWLRAYYIVGDDARNNPHFHEAVRSGRGRKREISVHERQKQIRFYFHRRAGASDRRGVPPDGGDRHHQLLQRRTGFAGGGSGEVHPGASFYDQPGLREIPGPCGRIARCLGESGQDQEDTGK